MASLSMNKGYSRWIIVFYIVFNKLIVAYHHNHQLQQQQQGDTHNVAKRMDIESCEGHFNIQREMIIRTEESRKLGAKYLDYAETGSREECLRLCCETDECDVFVFEEKSSGSCFLFHCGPAQNFRCKFVEHSNYTSAVFAPPVKKIQTPQSPLVLYPARPPTPASLSQHEIELSNLKGKSIIRGDPPTTANLPLNGQLMETTTKITATAASDKASKQCGRFQFLCHSGECIAIYNACDGIPQCFDGSDEGPGCPTTAPPIIKNFNLQKQTDGNSVLLQSNANSMVQTNVQQQQEIQQKQTDRLHNGVTRNREDPMTAPQPQWILPNRASQMETIEQQPYIDSASHIFNHKGGIQISNNNNNNNHPPMYASNVVRNPNIDMTNPYEISPPREPYMSAMQNNQGMVQNWPQQLPQFPENSIVSGPHAQHPQQQKLAPNQVMVDPQVQQEMMSPNWPVHPLLPVQDQLNAQTNGQLSGLMKQNVPLDKITTATDYKNNKIPLRVTDSDAGDSSDDKDSDYEDEEKPTEPPRKKSHKHKKLENKDKSKKGKGHGGKSDGDGMQSEIASRTQSDVSAEFLDHDGAAERPGGAVLSLTLGIIVTAALAILVGCRANVVRRRVRRGAKSTYAHDADFLVNGMYL